MATNGTPRSIPLVRCERCGALLQPEDLFCSVCGSIRPTARPAHTPRRAFWYLGVGAVCLALVFGMVAWIYFNAPERHALHPVAQVSGRPQALAILPGNPPTAVVATAQSTLSSQDSGSSWQNLGMSEPIQGLAASGTTPPAMYLAGDHLWRTDGAHLDTIATPLPSGGLLAIAVDPGAPNNLFAIVGGGHLFQSQDGGKTWTLLADGAPVDTTSLAIAPGPSPLLFVGTAGHGVLTSDDGQGWANASGFVNGALPTHVINSIAFDPRSGDRYVGPSGQTVTGALYVGTDEGLFKSIDHGDSWAALSFHSPIGALAVAPDGSHLMLAVGPDGSVYRSADSGVSWN